MISSAQPEAVEQGWDGPRYRVRTDRFEVSFLPDAGEELEAVCDVDVEVWPADGSRWSATVFTVAEVERLTGEEARTGEDLGGRCFWCSDGLSVRDPGIENTPRMLAELLGSGEFEQSLQRLDDE